MEANNKCSESKCGETSTPFSSGKNFQNTPKNGGNGSVVWDEQRITYAATRKADGTGNYVHVTKSRFTKIVWEKHTAN